MEDFKPILPNSIESPLNQSPPPCQSSSSSSTANHGNGDDHGALLTVDDYFNSFPAGYRFQPKNHELIRHYLVKKIKNEALPPNKIHDVDLYKYDPKTLTEKYTTYGEKEWYFFTPRDRKYPKGQRPNRAAVDGYWKATGADKTIKFKGVTVGFRKVLVFYTGKPPKGDKTTWIMHEYRVDRPPTTRREGDDMRLDKWVLCRLYKKDDKSTVRHRYHDDESNGNSDHQHIAAQDPEPEVAPHEVISSMALTESSNVQPPEMNYSDYINGNEGSSTMPFYYNNQDHQHQQYRSDEGRQFHSFPSSYAYSYQAMKPEVFDREPWDDGMPRGHDEDLWNHYDLPARSYLNNHEQYLVSFDSILPNYSLEQQPENLPNPDDDFMEQPQPHPNSDNGAATTPNQS